MGVGRTWVAYGRAAASVLRAEIAKIKVAEPLAPVTVLVPSNHVGVAARRLLASGDVGTLSGGGAGLVGVTFSTPYRLAELVGATSLATSGRRPVSTPVIAAAIRSVLAEAPGVFGPVAEHPSTESALVASYRELRDLPAASLAALADTSARAAEVVRVHQAAHARLESDWYDETDLMASAAASIRAGKANVDGLDRVIAYLPQALSLGAADLLAALGERGELVVVAGTTGHDRADADADVVRTLRRIGFNEPAGAASATFSVDRTSIVTASDADEEVRHAVRVVLDAVRAGTRLDRIAVLYAGTDPYARLAHEQLSAAGIRTNGTAFTSLDAHAAPRAIVQLLSLPNSDFCRPDLFTWLTSTPLRYDGRPAPVSAWERLSRRAGVVGGRADWDERLELLAASFDRDADAAEADPDAFDGAAERHRRDAERTRGLRTFVLGVIDSLEDAATQDKPWSEHVAWVNAHLAQLLGDAAALSRWPVAERIAVEKLDRALNRLTSLDAVEGAVSLDVFARTLLLELESDLGRVGRFGDGVFVGSVRMGVGLDLDLVVVLGLAEGSFPGLVREDSLLPDDERAVTGELTLRRDRIESEHREFLAAFAGANRRVLCVPRGDLRKSSRRVPSRWVLDIASQLAGERWWSEDLLAAPGNEWLTHVASYDAGLRRAARPATDQEYRLRMMMEDPDALGDARVEAATATVRSRRSGSFTRFDGNLAGCAVPSPADQVMSATRLESWAKCPFNYFVTHVLRAEQVENPEEHLQISAADKGTLIHNALEQFILEVLERAEPPAFGAPWSASDRKRLVELAEASCDDFEARGLTGREIFWKRDRAAIIRDIHRLLDEDDAHRARFRARPLAAELPFGFSWSPVQSVPMSLPDGRHVRFRGKADRVDIGEDGTLHVVDYKTGSKRSFDDLLKGDPTLAGKKLQLPVYGVAARLHNAIPDAPVVADYWFISEKGQFARIGYPITEEVINHFGMTVQRMVQGVEAGVFPNYPTSASTFNLWVDCDPCEPDGLGVVDLHRAWARKAEDPALVVFRQLIGELQEAEADHG